MKILFSLNHPAHYHMFKNLVDMLQKDGHDTKYVISNKDVLEDLLKNDGVEYIKLQERRKRKANVWSVVTNGIADLIDKDKALLRYVKKYRPNIMLGTDISIAHVGKLTGTPSLFFNEDDYEINKAACLLAYPFISGILAPDVCTVGKQFNRKKIGYKAYQKIAYIHPNYFRPDKEIVRKYIGDEDTYFIIRCVSLTAGHDISGKHTGIDNTLLDRLIAILEPKGKVLISSERGLSDKYKKYQLNVPPTYMHHIMNYSSLFIADSQSMCFEAGLMGVPYIRFNDFVGKINVLNEMENVYELGYGIKTDAPDRLLELTAELIGRNDLKSVWAAKKERLYNDKIDVNSFWKWFIENYPESKNIMRENPDYQYRFGTPSAKAVPLTGGGYFTQAA